MGGGQSSSCTPADRCCGYLDFFLVDPHSQKHSSSKRGGDGTCQTSLVHQQYRTQPLLEESNVGAEFILSLRNNNLEQAYELAKIVDVNRVDRWNRTPLIIASQKCAMDVCQRLLYRRALVNAQSKDGFTALMQASGEGSEKISSLLMEFAADVSLRAADGSTALIEAAKNGHDVICQMLLDRGADINCPCSLGLTPVMVAIQDGHRKACTLLLFRQADVERRNQAGQTVLQVAVQSGKADCFEAALEDTLQWRKMDRDSERQSASFPPMYEEDRYSVGGESTSSSLFPAPFHR